MSRIMHRNLRHTPPVAVSAEGIRIRDDQGRTYIDASGGAAVSSLGHAHPAVTEAIRRQLDRVAYAHTSFFTTEAAEALAERLGRAAPGGDSEVYLVSGGSEAMETALKLARQYFVETGQPQRTRFIARRQSYHGNTLGALAVGGNEWRRKPFAPLLADVVRVSACYEYRGRTEAQTLDQYTAALLQELEAAIVQAGPDTVIGFVAEPVVGATGGAIPPTPGYFRGVRELCDRYGILFIADEVMCGMGRCGTLFAIEQEGVVPDIVTVAKGLGAGYQPIGAVLARHALVEALRTRSGAFQHGHTYTGHPVAAACALAVQETIEREKLLEAVRARGEAFMGMLREWLGGHGHVGDIRGRGLLLGVELVTDRASREPFPPQHRLHAAIKERAMDNGLLVYPMGGTIDGVSGDHVLLAPPFIATDDDLRQVARLLRQSIDAAIEGTT